MPSQYSGCCPRRAPADTLIRCAASDGFRQWLSACGGALAVTMYLAGKIALLDWDATSGHVTLLLRQFPKPMGVAVRGDAATGRVTGSHW